MAASDMRNRRHVQPLLTWSTNILYPWIRSPYRVLSAGPAEPRFFSELVTSPPPPFSSGPITECYGGEEFDRFINNLVRCNEIIYQLTSKDNWELRVDMKAKDGDSAFSTYQDFWMSDESVKYRLHLSLYLGGTGGDSLTGHNNLQFTTRDCQTDKNGAGANCALIFKGGWWYNACHSSNLKRPQSQRSTRILR
ncbi:hypothetical protein LAZ67_3005500 [Cordylochernes scorpioides]|uniref:Fibrinogen C-terminal domain-containing protein n=1 Tax=Cordylochernes scorpioides TaxID=51811 RepID=A0ABY6KDI2_9ARAC|nr:hypothetical protein LAZ67_3005500 [Cordylochernes scorpioides]